MAVRELSPNEATTPIPEVKQRAILMVFDLVLLTRGDEASRIVDQIRGRRRVLPLTFGELRNMADAQKISNQATAAGVDDLGEAPTDLARVLQHITPDLAVCEACSKYPIAEMSGIVSLITEGRCPHCGEGLITAPKQAEPYMAWTTLEMVSPSQTHDRRSIPDLPLPLSNAAIEAEAGKGLYTIDPNVRTALEQEGLTKDGQPDFGKFLIFLAHGPRSSRFRGMDEVLVALGNPHAFRAYDPVSIRDVVRKAKSWTPTRAAPASDPPASDPVSSGLDPNKASVLVNLFTSIFSTSELSMFVRYGPCGNEASQVLSPGLALRPFAEEVLNFYQRHHLINTDFFGRLIKERPFRRDEIERCRKLVLGS